MKIIIADDNIFFRDALHMFLETELNHTVIAEYNNGADLIKNNKLANADIILLDIEMPQLNGILTMKEINKMYEWVKVIAITDYFEKAYLRELINNGFKGCVFKDSIFNSLQKTISIVHKGGMSFPTDISVT